MSHTTLFILDQDKAYDFYVNILGFKVHTDATMPNGFRWLTVTAPGAPDFEIVLMPALHESMKKSATMPEGLDEETINAIKLLLEKGVMGAGRGCPFGQCLPFDVVHRGAPSATNFFGLKFRVDRLLDSQAAEVTEHHGLPIVSHMPVANVMGATFTTHAAPRAGIVLLRIVAKS
jgi:catechol 2,3-dioxygenase-like lactoylglutathione lyase family enzyme